MEPPGDKGGRGVWEELRHLGLCTGERDVPVLGEQGHGGHRGRSHRGQSWERNLCTVSEGGCSGRCSCWFCPILFLSRLFPALGVGFLRDINCAQSAQLFFASGAFRGNQICRKALLCPPLPTHSPMEPQLPTLSLPGSYSQPLRLIFPCNMILHHPTPARLGQGSQQ